MYRSAAGIFFACLSTCCGLQAEDYLSDEYFPGLHILGKRPDSILVYKDGQKPSAGGTQVSVPRPAPAGWSSMQDIRADFDLHLAISPPEPLQTPWAFFDSQGKRIESAEEFNQLDCAFMLLIGQWMWPAVRVGFEQQAEGVLDGEPLTVRTLSLRPVVFQVNGFIRKKETEEVIRLGHKRDMVNSEGVLVSADRIKKRRHDDYRTSTQTWLTGYDGKTIEALDERTANLTRIHKSHNEAVQLLRYGEGQFYHSHLDWSDLPLYNGQRDHWRNAHFGWEGRLATLFWYLNDVEEGGQTVFPKHGDPICPDFRLRCHGASQPSMSDCSIGLRVKPKEGSVVLWYNYHPNGIGDQNALHGGCPPAPGLTKWSGNKWIHIKSLEEPAPDWMPDHPGLERFGWRDSMAFSSDPNECSFRVNSAHPSSLGLYWVDPGNNEHKHVSTIEPEGSASLNSYKGHKFVIKQGKKKTKRLVCKGQVSQYQVNEDLSVEGPSKPEL